MSQNEVRTGQSFSVLHPFLSRKKKMFVSKEIQCLKVDKVINKAIETEKNDVGCWNSVKEKKRCWDRKKKEKTGLGWKRWKRGEITSWANFEGGIFLTSGRKGTHRNSRRERKTRIKNETEGEEGHLRGIPRGREWRKGPQHKQIAEVGWTVRLGLLNVPEEGSARPSPDEVEAKRLKGENS